MENINYYKKIPSLKRLAAESAFTQGLTGNNLEINTENKIGRDGSILERYGDIKYANTNVHSDHSLYNKLKVIVENQSLQYILDFVQRYPDINNDNLVHCAAEVGNLDLLIWLNENGFEYNTLVFNIVSKYGHLQILQYLYHFFIDQNLDCPWDETTCEFAVEGGNLECLKWLHENGCPWNQYITICAARIGNVDCLKYAYENDCNTPIEISSYSIIEKNTNNLNCLEYIHIHINEHIWDSSLTNSASSNDLLDCLTYLHENQCPWNNGTCINAAINGHSECLRYALQNGCDHDDPYICTSAAISKNFECVEIARQYNTPWNAETCEKILVNSSFEQFQWAHNNGCPWDNHIYTACVYAGKLDCLEYAYNNQCPIGNLADRFNNYVHTLNQNQQFLNAMGDDPNHPRDNERLQRRQLCIDFIYDNNICPRPEPNQQYNLQLPDDDDMMIGGYYEKTNEMSNILVSTVMIIIIFGVSVLQTY
jgi:hypothetical protein